MILINAARVPCFIVAFAAIGCREKEAKPAAIAVVSQAGFDSVAARLVTALRNDAADSVMALMAGDVVLMPPSEPVLNGAAAVRTWYDGLTTQLRTSSLVISDREVRMGGEWVTEVAGYEWTLRPVAGGADMTERGSYVQIWHRESDGRYLLTRELWNSTVPLATPAGN
jgi:ketosteroid isomerase-like protein